MVETNGPPTTTTTRIACLTGGALSMIGIVLVASSSQWGLDETLPIAGRPNHQPLSDSVQGLYQKPSAPSPPQAEVASGATAMASHPDESTLHGSDRDGSPFEAERPLSPSRVQSKSRALLPGEDQADYERFTQIKRVRLPDAVDSSVGAETLLMSEKDVHRQIAAAWQEGEPIVIENAVPATMLDWWALNTTSPLTGKFASALGSQQVSVYRYADREEKPSRRGGSGSSSQKTANQPRAEDHRTRLMQTDSAAMKLADFLQRFHLEPDRAWPKSPLPGEMFMFKRKIPDGYQAASTQGAEPSGVVERYVRAHLPRPNRWFGLAGRMGTCVRSSDKRDADDELAIRHRFEWADPMLRLQTPFFTFPFHYDCYGNVLIQLDGQKRALLTHPRFVNITRSREIFDVANFFQYEGWERHVKTTVLKPGDGLFIPIGYWHSVAHGGMLPHHVAEQTGVGINFPAICTVDRWYRRAEQTCERNFERDFPHRSNELQQNQDYKTGRRRSQVDSHGET